MRFFSDLHIHSRYSRATSPRMTPEEIRGWAQRKGISVVGTGDFTHPAWLDELDEKLYPAENGLFGLRHVNFSDVPARCRADVFFVPTAEISCIYRKNGRTRKIHCLIVTPGLADARRINAACASMGRLEADGRPVFGRDIRCVLSRVLDASPESILIPAHAWTPHFSIFGAQSGFNSLDECFEELTPHIYAIETGLSSDPPMNRRVSALDGITLLSNSDAHSPEKIGREATIFDCDMSFQAIARAIKTGSGLHGTVEFFPEEGKYFADGHRNCRVCMSPREALNIGMRCPACGGNLTMGVMHRIEELADRDTQPKGYPPSTRIIPLSDILAEVTHTRPGSRACMSLYLSLLEKLGPELAILMDASLDEIKAAGSVELKTAIEHVRNETVTIEPGFDGKYGRVAALGLKK